jgi:hypothetical protein
MQTAQSRMQTIMQGASYCDFRYALKTNKPGPAGSA